MRNIYWLLVFFLLVSCSDDEDGSPSYLDVNWYQVEYDPNADALDQLRFEIYDQTGFPVFYNDTLGSTVYYDFQGKPYTYYEVFSGRYSFVGSSPASLKYSLLQDRDKILTTIKVLNEYVIDAYLGRGVGPKGFLVVDSLLVVNKFDAYSLDFGMTVVNYFGEKNEETGEFVPLIEMTEEEKIIYGWSWAVLELESYFDRKWADEFGDYQAITKEYPDISADKDLFEIGGTYNIKDFSIDVDNPRLYGILDFASNNGSSVFFPDALTDLTTFVEMIYTKTDADIRVEHGEYPMIIKRYEALLKLLEDSGATKFIKK